MKVKVKICGIRSLEQAEQSIAAGADFLGFNFVPTSHRFIDILSAKIIIEQIKGKVALVGVFQNQSVEEVNKVCQYLELNYAQLHGEETEEFCKQVTTPVIKAFGLQQTFTSYEIAKSLERYNIPYFLVDRENRGEGEMLSLTDASELAQTYPLFFSGGLTHENIAEVVNKVKPFAVDVASGVETERQHDLEKIKKFIQNAKEVDL